MADILWLIRRLKAMSFLEMQWRLSQNLIQKKEKTGGMPHEKPYYNHTIH